MRGHGRRVFLCVFVIQYRLNFDTSRKWKLSNSKKFSLQRASKPSVTRPAVPSCNFLQNRSDGIREWCMNTLLSAHVHACKFEGKLHLFMDKDRKKRQNRSNVKVIITFYSITNVFT